MTVIPRRSAAVTALVLGFFLAIGFSQRQVAAQSSDQKVEEVFKNIKSLNGQPADMLNPTMVFFEASLGVGCPYCHDNDANKRELDGAYDKKKRAASGTGGRLALEDLGSTACSFPPTSSTPASRSGA